MKLKKITHLKHKIIKLESIKLKLYQNSLQNLCLPETYLKKAISIIFQYHIKNKKILFVGVDRKKQNKFKHVFNKTKHIFLPESYWIRGLLTNKITIFRYIKKQPQGFLASKVKKYFLLKKKPNLIVILKEKKTTSIINEATKLKIPIIVLNTENRSLEKSVYQMYLDSVVLNQKNINILILILNSILRKKQCIK